MTTRWQNVESIVTMYKHVSENTIATTLKIKIITTKNYVLNVENMAHLTMQLAW